MKVSELFEEMSDRHFQLDMMARHMSANGLTPLFQVAREKALWIDVRLAAKTLARVSWIEKLDLWNITVYHNGRSLGTNRSLPFDDVVEKVQQLDVVGAGLDRHGAGNASIAQIKKILAEDREEGEIPLIFRMIQKILADGGQIISRIPYKTGIVSIRGDSAFSVREIAVREPEGDTWFELVPEDDEILDLEKTGHGKWDLVVIDGKEFVL